MNPYLIDLPAVVSFSGGRTSGFMLRHILDAHGGQPEDLRVCFQNTGLEHEKTYEFVEEVAARWDVHIDWLEYAVEDDKHAVRKVTAETASRNGEPFTALNKKKRYLPNPVARVCTTNLKLRTMDRFVKTDPTFANGYTNAIGLRADEPARVHKMKADNSREDVCCPMFDAGHTEADVLAWWKEQPFDLKLPLHGNMAGNCVGCFLKSRAKLEVLMEEMPEHFEWWARAEEGTEASAANGARFRQDRPSYRQMMNTVRTQGRLFVEDEDTLPCHCTD